MNSKEALENLNNRFGENGWGFNIEKQVSIIEKDLEVLEAIREIPSLRIALYNACDTEKYSTHKDKREKVKEWLNND